MKPEIRQAGITLIAVAVLLILGCVLAAIVGCQPPPSAEPETVIDPVAESVSVDWVKDANIPPEDRTDNWKQYGTGSCCNASACIILQEHGLPKTAEKWREAYGGKAGLNDQYERAVEAGLGFAYTETGSEAFLDWGSSTNRKLACWWNGGRHCIVFYGWSKDGSKAYCVDPNSASEKQVLSRESFISQWQNAGGVSFTLYAYASAPPEPVEWEGSGNYERTETVQSSGSPAVRRGLFGRIADRLRERRASHR